jgi:NitT/TauT family transport system substrate-binding protein
MNSALRPSLLSVFLLSSIFVSGCGKVDNAAPGAPTTVTTLRFMLDWQPEPEFGGFYSAQQTDIGFAKQGLSVTIKPSGPGAPTWQQVATGDADFATTAADQVLIARKAGADVIAIFAVYQTSPQGIMVHKSRGFTSMKDVFTHEGTLLAEDNTWLQFLRNKFGPGPVKMVAYDNGIAQFLAKPDLSQQCFITSEPLAAARKGGDPQTFLVADEGFNPYTTVVICKGDLWRKNPDEVKAMAAACREGWRAYLDNPGPTNAIMHDLNKDMDPQTFAEAAAAQKPLIETNETRANGLGTMTAQRWTALAGQLSDLGVLNKPVKGEDCFVNP